MSITSFVFTLFPPLSSLHLLLYYHHPTSSQCHGLLFFNYFYVYTFEFMDTACWIHLSIDYMYTCVWCWPFGMRWWVRNINPRKDWLTSLRNCWLPAPLYLVWGFANFPSSMLGYQGVSFFSGLVEAALLLRSHGCSSPARARRHNVTAGFLWVFLSKPSSMLFPEPWGEGLCCGCGSWGWAQSAVFCILNSCGFL